MAVCEKAAVALVIAVLVVVVAVVVVVVAFRLLIIAAGSGVSKDNNCSNDDADAELTACAVNLVASTHSKSRK